MKAGLFVLAHWPQLLARARSARNRHRVADSIARTRRESG